ncbi:MBOAT family O-acyltransferase [Anoxynatronum buryatiense]|uniref:Alginate O-acetyltransferase complex protein AlgI n=1 Tax=Anoxynatronum buryatiense TaxID=489973 RepID=A0AA45WV01_9CLOT|nr:MBOAT family O-acyltransferase [Anoxynatronum buryatiense]SMP50835.1 alginate O-acetyltransferase complex protein AlgI [Anoxynatronum buryatiense]
MVFSSLTFLFYFLPLHLFFYYASPSNVWRNWVLIVFSLVFYAWGEPVWISLLIFSASIDFLHGRLIENNRTNWKRKAALCSSIALNLSLLGFFKYASFFAEALNRLLGTDIPLLHFGLPIGISFYTFQTMSYVIDVYSGKVKAQQRYAHFLMYVSLFHQLVAGPIVRYRDIAREIEHRTMSLSRFSLGISRFSIGLGKKVIIANAVGEASEHFLLGNFSALSVLGAWFGIALFGLQIYYDFSGYSDMAIGLGHLFGFTYLENFRYPYIARSASDFWRRWHISLGSFFRDYVYIPLGGNRKRMLLNLFIVWFLTGLWHGASWNFVLWGLYFGLLVMLEKIIQPLRYHHRPPLPRLPEWFSKMIGHIYLITVVLIGWVFFYFTDLSHAFSYLAIMAGLAGAPLVSTDLVIQFNNHLILFAVAIILSTPFYPWLQKRWRHLSFEAFQPVINAFLLLASTALLVGASYNPFLYFRF